MNIFYPIFFLLLPMFSVPSAPPFLIICYVTLPPPPVPFECPLQVSVLMQQHRQPVGEVVKADEKQEDYSVDTTDLASRFRFFLNYEKDKEKEKEKNRKVFRITPPREGVDQVEDVHISKANMPKPCMAVNCAACKLRVIANQYWRQTVIHNIPYIP